MNERMLALYSLVNGKNEKVSKIKLKKKKACVGGRGTGTKRMREENPRK